MMAGRVEDWRGDLRVLAATQEPPTGIITAITAGSGDIVL
jgi:hypothetical protein